MPRLGAARRTLSLVCIQKETAMKRYISLFLALALCIFALAACKDKPAGQNEGEQTGGLTIEKTDGDAAGTQTEGEEPEYYSGQLGDVMHTYFFDFSVNDVYMCDDYNGRISEEGLSMLVADVTITNSFDSEIPMSDWDFQLIWGEGDEEFAYPITSDSETGEALPQVSPEQLPAEYSLAQGESINGKLVFDLPEGLSSLSIATMDMYSDDTTGDVYFVDFEAAYM